MEHVPPWTLSPAHRSREVEDEADRDNGEAAVRGAEGRRPQIEEAVVDVRAPPGTTPPPTPARKRTAAASPLGATPAPAPERKGMAATSLPGATPTPTPVTERKGTTAASPRGTQSTTPARKGLAVASPPGKPLPTPGRKRNFVAGDWRGGREKERGNNFPPTRARQRRS
ncbi:Os03g0393400 [Oryza sativa Japonica Group]|uniref:Os03g0393400 protein n=1 Tax=Oryza sativa subsp. japonica TaxID=39947 RepID=A0A0P0VZ75_ORYSJ|nr:Os03g0393400 [Oryza sativa Japonica Group]